MSEHPGLVVLDGVNKHFGDLHVSFSGKIRNGKFSGVFAFGLLAGGTGCGTATMPASAHK